MNYESPESVSRKTFSKNVDLRSKKAMASFLAGHFRYPTANSWNNATSYACNMKILSMGLPPVIEDRLLDLSDTEEFYEALNGIVRDFGREHGWAWQAGWNGRSGGYLVLYQGGIKETGHKSVCRECGQRNFKSVSENGTRCGRCGAEARVDFRFPPKQIYTFPGKGTDDGMEEADFLDMDIRELRDRVRLVKSFDDLADAVASEAIRLALECEAAVEVVLVPHERKVMKPRSADAADA